MNSALQKYIKINYNQILLKVTSDGDIEAVNELLNNHRSEIDLECKNDDGDTSLRLACLSGHKEVVKRLIEAGSDVNTENKLKRTPLTGSCNYINNTKYHSAIIEMLLKAGCDKDHIIDNGNSALIIASDINNMSIVELLLKAGCNIDHKNNYGNTALIAASEKGHTAIVELLLKAGCDKDVKNKYGNTALMIAKQKDYKETVKLLSQKSREETVRQLVKEIQERLDQLNKLI